MDAHSFLVDNQAAKKALETSSVLGGAHWLTGFASPRVDGDASALSTMAFDVVRSRKHRGSRFIHGNSNKVVRW